MRRPRLRLLSPQLLVLLLLLLPPTDGRAQERVGEVFRRVNPSVVIIRARWKEVTGRVSEVGSGFLISADGKIITADEIPSLTPSYLANAHDLAERRIALAGYRLAEQIKKVLPK